MSDSKTGCGWTSRDENGAVLITLSGDWIASSQTMQSGTAQTLFSSAIKSLSFNISELGRSDSALVSFLVGLRDAAHHHNVSIDMSALPPSTQQLVNLVGPPSTSPPPLPRAKFIEMIGTAAIAIGAGAIEISAMIGNLFQRSAAVARGRGMMRRSDFVDIMWEVGPRALPIVTVINLLVGGILAFVGAVQLRRFGADIYVASLVGIGVTREMAALMTAIIMAGRSGGAYAATIASMRGNEEIDALTAVGIPVFDYLILPRILALSITLPILYLYGCAIGFVGGFVVAISTLNISAAGYLQETLDSVSLSQFALGFMKSLIFGALIAIAACHVGLKAGYSAADVGIAATSAVVASVVGVIAVDAIFDVCANIINI